MATYDLETRFAVMEAALGALAAMSAEEAVAGLRDLIDIVSGIARKAEVPVTTEAKTAVLKQLELSTLSEYEPKALAMLIFSTTADVCFSTGEDCNVDPMVAVAATAVLEKVLGEVIWRTGGVDADGTGGVRTAAMN